MTLYNDMLSIYKQISGLQSETSGDVRAATARLLSVSLSLSHSLTLK